MKFRVTHSTEFIYDATIGLCYNEVRCLPRVLPYQKVHAAELKIDPAPADHFERYDYFGNRTAYLSIQRPHDRLVVTASSVVETTEPEQSRIVGGHSWELVREQLKRDHSAAGIEAIQYVLDSPSVTVNDLLLDYARPSFSRQRPLVEAVTDLMQRIFREFKYDPEFSTIATPLKEVLQHRSGVCQDFAHLAIGCLRSLGLAARYVSGYIETQPPPGKERLIGADASHAWFAVYLPGSGWLDFDPTNNQRPKDRHITVAWGRDFSDVTPLKGVAFGSGDHELNVSVDVFAMD